MRVALLVALAVLATVSPSILLMSPGTSHGPAGPAARIFDLPPSLLSAAYPSVPCDHPSLRPSGGLLNLPAAGTGAAGTWNVSDFVNNTGVNSTITVPNGLNLGNNQFLVLGVADPIKSAPPTGSSTPPVAAAGVAMTSNSTYSVSNVAVPAAFLPNGTLIVNENIFGINGPAWTTFSQGSTHKFVITHKVGDWWSFTFDGSPIVGGTVSGGIAWENGTYNLGVSAAAGTVCEEGASVGPSFLAVSYGMSGAATPNMPTTNVPYAVGVKNAAGSWYIPASTNAMPQFNSSMKVVGIQGHLQVNSLAVDQLTVGTSVPFPGPLTSLWGNFKVVILNKSSLTPVQAALAYAATQVFNATAINQNGVSMANAHYSWQFSPATLGALNATTGPSVKFTASSTAVTGRVWANISYNCSSISDEANVTVTKTGGPSILSFNATPSSILVNQATRFLVINGSWPNPISYSYVNLPTNCTTSNSSSFSCNPSSPGVYNVTVYLNDSKRHTSSATTTLDVHAKLAISSFTATPSILDINTTVKLSVVSTGGLPPVVYNYSGLPGGSGCTNGTQPATFTCRPLETGKFMITVVAKDAAGNSVTRNTNVTINAPLALSSFTALPASVAAGQTVYLNTTVTPGTGTSPYSYAYSGLPKGCTTQSVASLVCITSSTATPGTYLVNVTVTDASGKNISGSSSFTLNPPAATAPTVTGFVATPNPVNVNQATVLNVTTTGGTGPLTYSYSGLPTGCLTQNASTLSCTPTVGGGPFHIVVTVTDAKKLSGAGSLNLTVNQASGAPTISAFSATPSSVNVGSSTVISVTASGGTPPLSYAFTGLPPGCTTTNKASFACTPSQVGNYTITVYVNDSANHGSSRNTVLQVTPASGGAGSPTIDSFAANPSTMQLGGVTQLKVTASGGTQTLSYAYTGLPSGCLSEDVPTLSCQPTSAGNYTIRVYVNDSTGSSTAVTLLTVTTASSSAPASGIGSYLVPVVLIIGVVAAAGGIAAYLVHRRKSKAADSVAEVPPPPLLRFSSPSKTTSRHRSGPAPGGCHLPESLSSGASP